MEFLIPIALFVCIAAVLIFRPLTRRLGDLIQAYTEERLASQTEQRKLTGLREHLESLDQRMSLLEERMSFTEDLMGREAPRSLREPSGRADRTDTPDALPDGVGRAPRRAGGGG